MKARASCPIETPDYVTNPHKDNYNFQFYCLCGLATIGSFCLVMAVIALILMPLPFIGIGLATIGALMCSYGFFKLFNKKEVSPSQLPKLEIANPFDGPKQAF